MNYYCYYFTVIIFDGIKFDDVRRNYVVLETMISFMLNTTLEPGIITFPMKMNITRSLEKKKSTTLSSVIVLPLSYRLYLSYLKNILQA